MNMGILSKYIDRHNKGGICFLSRGIYINNNKGREGEELLL